MLRYPMSPRQLKNICSESYKEEVIEDENGEVLGVRGSVARLARAIKSQEVSIGKSNTRSRDVSRRSSLTIRSGYTSNYGSRECIATMGSPNPYQMQSCHNCSERGTNHSKINVNRGNAFPERLEYDGRYNCDYNTDKKEYSNRHIVPRSHSYGRSERSDRSGLNREIPRRFVGSYGLRESENDASLIKYKQSDPRFLQSSRLQDDQMSWRSSSVISSHENDDSRAFEPSFRKLETTEYDDDDKYTQVKISVRDLLNVFDDERKPSNQPTKNRSYKCYNDLRRDPSTRQLLSREEMNIYRDRNGICETKYRGSRNDQRESFIDSERYTTENVDETVGNKWEDYEVKSVDTPCNEPVDDGDEVVVSESWEVVHTIPYSSDDFDQNVTDIQDYKEPMGTDYRFPMRKEHWPVDNYNATTTYDYQIPEADINKTFDHSYCDTMPDDSSYRRNPTRPERRWESRHRRY